MKPIPELFHTSLRSMDGLIRKGRAYEYLQNGGDPALFDDQVVMRVVIRKWRRIRRHAKPRHRREGRNQ